MKGKIEIITGCMFSGKSTELLNKVEEYSLKTLFVKPRIDSRYDDCKINTHSGKKANAIIVDSISEIFSKLSNIKLVAIDEAQFFNISITNHCIKIRDMGINIILAGLEYDYLHKRFDSMTGLLQIADSVKNLTAQCVKCPQPATHSHRIVSENSKILVGHQDFYEPLCAKCYSKNV